MQRGKKDGVLTSQASLGWGGRGLAGPSVLFKTLLEEEEEERHEEEG